MRIAALFLMGLSLIAIFTCNKDDVLNQDSGKEIARIFFVDVNRNMDVEEVRGDADNRVTCKLVGTLGPGIRVIVTDQNNRKFLMDFQNVQDELGLKIMNGFAEYTDQNAITYKTIGLALQEVEVSWRRNFDICEFTWDAGSNPVELRSNTDSILIDSLKIETLREDDL